jgi:outer membrane lipoprotein-sorting protein
MKGMLFRRLPATVLVLCLLVIGESSCLVRRRLITRTGTSSGKTAQNLLIADEQTLIDSIAKQYNAIRDFSATVDLVPALGSAEKSHITEYKDVTGYILFKKPATIRLIGLYPVVRSKAFDMVSDGQDFKMYIPARNLFITGRNEIVKPAANKLENLRPQHFLDAMMIRPIDQKADRVLMENLTDEDEAFYIIHEIHEASDGKLQLKRSIWFNRLDLLIARQLIFDADGNILTDARYSQWKPFDNVPFPKHIDINRPRDEYGVVLDVRKMDINKGVSDDKFVLTQPEGTKLQVVGQPSAPAPAKETAVPKGSLLKGSQ